MKRFLLLTHLVVITFWCIGQQPDSTQVDLIDIVIGKKKLKHANQYRSDKKVHFSILPAAVSVAGGGRAVITAVNAAFYLGDPAHTNLSNVYLVPYTNLADRYGVYIRPNLWLAQNAFNLLGDYRIAHFPHYTWGLGGNSPEWDQSLIDSDYIRVYQTVLKKITGNWFAGPGYSFDYHYNIEETEYEGEGHLDRYEESIHESTVSSGITINLVFDARTNAINPPGGGYGIISWRWNTEGMGSTYDYQSLFIDLRKYIPLSRQRTHILAFRSWYWTLLSGTSPYLDLPATNWAPASGISSRGFQIGRYRSNAMLYGELEQRYQLSPNGLWGLVAFANIASASEFNTQHFDFWQVGAGFGLRTKFNKYSNSNVAIDFGFSENYWSIWLNIGEMF